MLVIIAVLCLALIIMHKKHAYDMQAAKMRNEDAITSAEAAFRSLLLQTTRRELNAVHNALQALELSYEQLERQTMSG